MPELTVEDVSRLLASYDAKDTKTTDELYEMGSMLVAECVDRVHQFDSKAGGLVGYAGAILALLVSTFKIWKGTLDTNGLIAVFCAAVSFLLAGGFSVMALRLGDFDWFSPEDWFKEKYFGDPEMLRRFHIVSMYVVTRSHKEGGDRKTGWIAKAQVALAVGAFLLVLGLGDAMRNAAAQGGKAPCPPCPSTTTISSSSSTSSSSTPPATSLPLRSPQ